MNPGVAPAFRPGREFDTAAGRIPSWCEVLDVQLTAHRPDCLTGYAWVQFPDRVREVHRGLLEFWYDPLGCALTDEELALLRPHRAFDHQVEVLRDLRRAGGIVSETWAAGPGQHGHARRRYTAAQASSTESGRESLELIGGV